MQHDRIVGLVQNQARLSSRGRAEGLLRAVLESLQKRLHPATAVHLAAQLPPALGEHLRRNLPYEKLSRDEFLHDLALREHVSFDVAALHAGIVLSLLPEMVTEGMFEKVLGELPEEFHPLFDQREEAVLRQWEDFRGMVTD